jgi:hypothetical protein
MIENRSPRLERPVMREQFRKELRGRLLSEAVVALAPRRGRFSFPLFLRPALAAAAILVLVLAGTTSAAASSLPGDALYSVKRANEDVQVALTFDRLSRLRLLSNLADRRLGELAEVALQRPSAAQTATRQYADALDRVARALEDAQGPSQNNQQGEDVQEAQAQRLKTLDSIKDTMPEDARSGVDQLLKREKDREKDRQPKTPAAPPTTEVQNVDEQNAEGGNAKKAPQPKPAMPHQDSNDQENDARHE